MSEKTYFVKRSTLTALHIAMQEWERLREARMTPSVLSARAVMLDQIVTLSRQLLEEAGWPLPE